MITMAYNPEIHHRRTIRLKDYDYSSQGPYFVTICVQERECLFGEIADCEMRLTDAGRMVESSWRELFNKYPLIDIDSFVVMPNHFHGIVLLNDGRGESCIRPLSAGDQRRGESCIRPVNQGDHKDRPYSGTREHSLGRILQAFKSMTTVEYIRGVQQSNWRPFPGRLWQRNYYERIIRNEAELDAARKYITENPTKWEEDNEYPAYIP